MLTEFNFHAPSFVVAGEETGYHKKGIALEETVFIKPGNF